MALLTIRFDLSFGTRTVRAAMAAGMVFAAVPELASESVTLTTYYPAPSGVYSQLITTGNTWLARDSNGVTVGSASTAKSKLDVFGNMSVGTYAGATAAPANGLIVSGPTGVGTSAPKSALDVGGGMAVGSYAGVIAAPANGLVVSGLAGVGTTNPAGDLNAATNFGGITPASGISIHGSGQAYEADLAVTGRIQTGDGNGTGGVWLSNQHNLFVGQNNPATNDLMLWTKGVGAALDIQQSGAATFLSDVRVTGNVTATSAACYSINIAPNGNQGGAGCPSGSYYITTIGGVYAPYMTMPFESSDPTGAYGAQFTLDALCCACPVSTGCNL